MAGAKSTTPALRFKGFFEEWKEQKASKIFLTVADKGHPDLPVLSATQDRGMIKREHTGINISHDERNEITYKRVMPGQFVIHLRSFQGGLAHSSSEGITSPAYTVMDFIQKECQYDQYWKHIFNSEKFIKSLEAVTYGIRDGRSISFDDFSTLSFSYPMTNEQKKIGNYFQNLDGLIALQRRKLVKLQNVKKAMLQKMFPTRGGTTPQIRFAGFTEPWQEQKLGDLAEIVRGASPRPIKDPRWFNSDSEIGWLRISDVTEQDGRIQYLEQRLSAEGQEHTRVLTEPHLLLSIAATVGKPLVNYVPTGVHDGFLIFLNPQFDREFMFQWLEMFRPQWSQYGQPGSQVNLNSDLVKNKTLLLPDEKEQIKIGIYFKHLDARISLQQRKLEKLQNVKKACLAAMFV